MSAPIARARVRRAEFGACISSRRHSEVFRFGGDRVLKLYRAHVPPAQAEHDLRITRLAHAAGVPTPAVEPTLFDSDDGRKGLMFEYVDATPCSELFQRRPERAAQYARLLADVHRRVHGFDAIDGLPAQRTQLGELLLKNGRLSLRQRQLLLALLEGTDAGERLCHGNFHPSNVLVSGDRAWVLSLGHASNGAALADVARTSTVLAYPDAKSGGLGAWLSVQYSRWRNRCYLRHYLGGSAELQRQFTPWLTIQMARRLDDGISAAETRALERRLQQLLHVPPQPLPARTA